MKVVKGTNRSTPIHPIFFFVSPLLRYPDPILKGAVKTPQTTHWSIWTTRVVSLPVLWFPHSPVFFSGLAAYSLFSNKACLISANNQKFRRKNAKCVSAENAEREQQQKNCEYKRSREKCLPLINGWVQFPRVLYRNHFGGHVVWFSKVSVSGAQSQGIVLHVNNLVIFTLKFLFRSNKHDIKC